MKTKTFCMIFLLLASVACKGDPSRDYTQVYQLQMLLDLLPYYTPGVTVYAYSCNVPPEKCHNSYRDTRQLHKVSRSCYQSDLLETHCPVENSVGACVLEATNSISVLETVYYSPSHTNVSARELCPAVTFEYGSQYFADTYVIQDVWLR